MKRRDRKIGTEAYARALALDAMRVARMCEQTSELTTEEVDLIATRLREARKTIEIALRRLEEGRQADTDMDAGPAIRDETRTAPEA